jgi:peptidoglycan/xylan/chitin deacetylase (PgdA/CDA1 family)
VAVCENIKNHLVQDFSYKPSRIKVLPNPIKPEKYYFVEAKRASSAVKRIAIVGRTTGPKAQRTEQVIKTLFSEDFVFEVSLIGGVLADLNLPSDIKNKIIEVPHGELNSAVYSQYDLIVGSGRVAIEALITGVPVIAFGEACYVGLVTELNFAEACKSNFGDIHPDSKEPKIEVVHFVRDVQSTVADLKSLSQKAEETFSLSLISASLQRIYESAYFLKNFSAWIPALMYHKIPENEIQSKHKIFVTRANFEKHLQFFKSRGFETLTFSQLEKFRKAELSFKTFPKKPLLLTFDDGYRDNLENASPLLKKYGFKAQLFLLANSQINQNSWDAGSTEPAHEIVAGKDRKLWLDSAFEIGSHGFSHEKITDLDDAAAFKELSESKKSLEAEFKVPVNSFAFTYGITSDVGTTLAQKAGYSYALNTDNGALLMEEDPYAIFRVNIFPNEDFWSLLKKTSSWYRLYYRFKRRK